MRLRRFFSVTRSAAPLALCRIGLGTAALLRGLKTARDLYLLQFDPDAIPARIFDWAPHIDTLPKIVVIMTIWFVACVGVIAGYRARLSAFVLSSLSLLLMIVDQNFWGHHVYFLLLMLFLLSLSDSDATWSVRWWRDGRPGRDVTAWPLWLMQIQLSLVYFFTAIAKTNPLFLSGGVLSGYSSLSDIPGGAVLVTMMSVIAVAGEYFLSFALWFARLRPWAIAFGVMLHGGIPIVMGLSAGLIVFSVATLSVYALFLDERTLAFVHQWTARSGESRTV